MEVDAKNPHEQQGRASHQHQRQFHGSVFLFPATPDADQQVHGDEGHLVKHEHGEEVHGDKEPEYPDGQQVKPQEILFLQEIHFP